MTDWGSLPLLPLGCILKYLGLKDALAATATCKHWRNGVMLYARKARKETLKLNIKHLEKCEFLVRLFKRNVRRLYLFIDCNEPEIEKFMKVVFVHFFDIVRLQELMFIGPIYMQQSNHVPFIKLRRITIEALIYKNSKSLLKLGFLGCFLQTSCERENERFSHSAIEEHSRTLNFTFMPCLSDTVLCRANERLMPYSALLHIIVDYDHINTAALITLSRLGHLCYLSINLTNRKLPNALVPIDWELLEELFNKPLQVCVNIIGVPIRRFEDIMEKVLVPGMKLVSLKVMFCKSLYTPLIAHASRVYQDSLMEMVWVDCPYDSTDPYHRVVRPYRNVVQPPTPMEGPDGYAHVNPFVLLCWQCHRLLRLVIHGYWVWQYDVTGFVRLRQNLAHLEISAVYDRPERFHDMVSLSQEGTMRVLSGDRPMTPDPEHLREVSALLEVPWRPTPWSQLHPALRSRASPLQRAHYLAAETRAVLNNRARENENW